MAWHKFESRAARIVSAAGVAFAPDRVPERGVREPSRRDRQAKSLPLLHILHRKSPWSTSDHVAAPGLFSRVAHFALLTRA
jgi:hypothetical protein